MLWYKIAFNDKKVILRFSLVSSTEYTMRWKFTNLFWPQNFSHLKKFVLYFYPKWSKNCTYFLTSKKNPSSLCRPPRRHEKAPVILWLSSFSAPLHNSKKAHKTEELQWSFVRIDFVRIPLLEWRPQQLLIPNSK